MRIALVSPYDLGVPGGVQSHVRQLAAVLRAAGDEVVLVGPGEGPDHLAVGASRAVPFNGAVAPVALGPGTFGRTSRLLRRLRPQVVHVHEPVVPWVGTAAALRAPRPLVATFHAWSAEDRAYRLVRPLGRAVLRRCAAAIAVSPAAAAYHAGALGVDPGAFTVVPNGVEVARFAGAADDPVAAGSAAAADAVLVDRPAGEVVLFVGRLEPRKGLAVLLEAAARLLAARPQLTVVVVGDGPQRATAAARLPTDLRHRVRFVGRVDDAALAAWYRTADVYVAPALGGESFGIVLLEAMAAGTVVVASDLPGFRSVVTDGRDGRLVPVGDPAALAAVLQGLLDDPGQRAALSAAGRDRAAAHDWSVVAARLRSIYLEASERALPR